MNDESLSSAESKKHTPGASNRLAMSPESSHEVAAGSFDVAETASAGESIGLRELRQLGLDRQQINEIVESVPGGAANVQDVYRLSPLQEGILFHHLLNQQNDTYVLSILFELQSRAHVDVLVSALNEVMGRHDILRTAVRWQNLPQPLQVVYRKAMLPVDEFTLEQGQDPLVQLKQRMAPAWERMDLQQAPLLRLQVAVDPRTARCYAVLRVHHIACDHQSLRVVVAETMAFIDGAERDLSTPAPFRAYVTHALANASHDDAESFFRSKLGTVDEPTAPFGLLDVHGDGSQIDEHSQSIDPLLAHDVRLRARRAGVTAARLFHAAWGLVVARTSGRDDVVYGTVVLAARQRSASAERMLGLSVNTLPLRLRLQNTTAAEFVEQTHRELVDVLNHEATPLALAQRCSGISGATPLFTSILNYRHTKPDQEADRRSAAGIRVLARGEAWTNYPVTLTVDDTGEGFVVAAKVDGRIGAQRMVSYLCTALRSLADALDKAPLTPVLELPILPEAERRQLIEEFNATRKDYPKEKLIHELFEEQVERTAQAVAVAFSDRSLTYAELNARANQLARHLRESGIGPDQLVGLCVERSLEMLVGLLGILKAGGAYVPLDPTNPAERLEHVLSDAKPLVLLTQESLRSKLPATSSRIVALDSEWAQIEKHAAENLPPSGGRDPRNLAYVIYTSGSTGRPKGVMVEHRNVINYATHASRQFDVAGGDGSLICTSISFDLMLTGLYPTLLSGKTIRLCREEQGLPLIAEELLRCSDLAPLKLTPSHLALLEQPLRAGKLAGRVRVLALGGEQLQAAAVQLWRKHAPDTRIFNHYGPTETTVGCVVHEIEDPGAGAVPIGRPISNTRLYILDGHRHEVPVGVVGEIYIGGDGVARGYLNRPELTAERFVADPYSDDPGARLYKTGDLGRWRSDGVIEYLGRNDQQVKIRGYRIELGEIEAQLMRHELLKEAVVIAREDESGNKSLVAYVVHRDSASPGEPAWADGLRAHLKQVLPEYMMPSAFVALERMPITPNGKLDRRALPEPELGGNSARRYETPQGEVEEILAGIWQQLLRVERVGRHDNFFELGGHSLLILQMLERLRTIGLSAELRSVFESSTLADLASVLTRHLDDPAPVPPNLIPENCAAITPQMLPLVELQQEHIERIVRCVPGGAANVQDIYPLAPLQEGILFLHLLNEESGDPYVVPLVLSVSSQARLQELIAALQTVVDRHDILRTALLWDQLPCPVQVVHRRAALPVEEITLSPQRDMDAQIEEWLKPGSHRLDLRSAPLLRLQVAADARTGQWHVLLLLHHITCDYTSREIVTAEVLAQLQGRAETLPASVPYRNHVAHALADARSGKSEAFFRSRLGDVDEPTAPFGLTNVRGDGSQIDEALGELEPAVSRCLRKQAGRLGVGPAALFHAAWALVVACASRRDDVVFGTVLLGRLQGRADAQRILGMFINTLPLRLRLAGVTARELVEQAQRELIQLLEYEQTSLAVAQRCGGIAGSGPLFTALLNYRHSAAKELEWAGADGVRMRSGHARTNYPIVLSVDDVGDGFRFSAQTDRSIDPARIVRYICAAATSLVDALERAPHEPALRLPVLPDDERRQVIEVFNATRTSYPRSKPTHELFEEQVRRTPEAIAAVFEGQSLSYAELNRMANRFAHYLRGRGVEQGEFVPVLMERSMLMLIAQLATLKCGGVYVPIDPELPTERRAFMIHDCGARHIVTDDGARVDFPTQCVVIDCGATADAIAGQPDTDIGLGIDAGAPQYVMFTSGSTGVPKGVVVPHYAVNRLAFSNGYAEIGPDDCLAHYSNPAFDAATFEVWAALLKGAKVVIVRQSVVLEPKHFAEVLKDQRVTALYMSAGLFNQCTEALADVFAGLRYLLVGGESLEPGTIRRVLRNSAPRRLLNAYGPTECTTFSTTHLIEDVEEGAKSIPIGRPISNAQIYILDADRQPLPIGVVGEMYIGGDGVATGYLNRPQLTAERFVADPFSADPAARLYKTGDLAYWRPDGTVEFLGRNDHQVKIRGFRIELGEIEARLLQHACLREAVVIAREDVPGEKRLVAYFVAVDSSAVPAAEELRTYLKDALPEYMLPSAFMALDSMPLTSTGKVNRRALPAPALTAYANRRYEAPRGRVEEILASIWQRVLGVERVGREDDFFEIGGHSLLALRAVSEVEQALGVSLRVTDAYKSPTIRDLASRIEAGTSEDRRVDLLWEASLDPRVAVKPGLRRASSETRAVLVTGGTGFVGRFLLAQLLERTNATLYCLVRAPSAQQASFRLHTSLMQWDLWREEYADRVVAVAGDLRLPKLGIDELTYRLLAHNVDSIYHCATSMNHLETYAMARAANVSSCRELLALATTDRLKLINYVSSLGVFSSPGRIVHEHSAIELETHWNSRGYVASKWVGEKIFMTAAERGIPCNIFRLGLVWADTQGGRYDELQREYRILKSCLMSGIGIANYRYQMCPTPVDYVARAVTFLGEKHQEGRGIFHIASSRQAVDGVFECYNETADMQLKLVSFYDWIGEVKRRHREGRSLPAVPLVEFAFAMNEEGFHEHQRRLVTVATRFDCDRTHRELEEAGIIAPMLTDRLLRLCVDSMLARDPDLRDLTDPQVGDFHRHLSASGRRPTRIHQ